MNIDLSEVIALRARRERQSALFDAAVGQFPEFWQAVREIYRLEQPSIEAGEFCAYIVDWTRCFSPIEREMWMTLRYAGAQMYPQFPIGRYIADFANPWTREVVECDGRQWHDPEKDAARDAWMQAQGWRVHRITGSQCVRADFTDDDAIAEDSPLAFIGRLLCCPASVVRAYNDQEECFA